MACFRSTALLPLFATRRCAPAILCRAISIFAGMSPSEVEIPRHRIEASFSRSSGAGGQNVNKLNTKAELRFHIEQATWLDEHTKARLRELFPNSVNKEGELVITSQRHRTQEGNLEDAFGKLTEMVAEAAQIPKVREVKTEPSEHTKQKYRDDKRHRAELKERRRSSKSGGWDD